MLLNKNAGKRILKRLPSTVSHISCLFWEVLAATEEESLIVTEMQVQILYKNTR